MNRYFHVFEDGSTTECSEKEYFDLSNKEPNNKNKKRKYSYATSDEAIEKAKKDTTSGTSVII